MSNILPELVKIAKKIEQDDKILDTRTILDEKEFSPFIFAILWENYNKALGKIKAANDYMVFDYYNAYLDKLGFEKMHSIKEPFLVLFTKKSISHNSVVTVLNMLLYGDITHAGVLKAYKYTYSYYDSNLAKVYIKLTDLPNLYTI